MPNLNVGLGVAFGVTVNAQADDFIYVLANCGNISSNSPYFKYCDESVYEACSQDMAIACSWGDRDYDQGAVVTLYGTRFLVCFHNDDAGACMAMRDGCSSQYPSDGHDLVVKDSPSVNSLVRAENIEQLKCCHKYDSSGYEDIGNGIQCDSRKTCNSDGSMSILDEFCNCKPGYYSTGYSYAPGRDLMMGLCAPCADTIGDTVADRLPTSNGNVVITGCYLPKGTNGMDDTGIWKIENGNCFYSK